MLKRPKLNFTAIAVSLFGVCCVACAQEKPPLPVRSWDLNVDADYATRMAKQLRIITLRSPTIIFVDNQKIAVTYEDGRGASPSNGTILVPGTFARKKAESLLYKFHALIFDVNTGPGIAKHLEWDAIREQAQLIPTHDGGFAVRVDNQFMVYSSDSQLKKQMTLDYHGDKPLATGEEVFEESYTGGISNLGHSLVVCHVLRGRHSGGGTQVSWYDTTTLTPIGGASEIARAGGCALDFKVADDNTVYSGSYRVDPKNLVWKKINPRCIACPPDSSEKPWQRFEVLAPGHFFVFGKNDEIVDEDGHQNYLFTHEPGMRVDGIHPAADTSRVVYSDGQSKDEPGHRQSLRIHVVDWREKRKIAVLKVIQDASPVVHDGGLQLQQLGVMDVTYALSPDGKELAILDMNSLKVYDLP
jgi:hypothetical protein